MNSHITILSTTAIPTSLRVDCYRVERTEVTPYAPDFILEDLMVEAGFESTLS